MDSGGSSARLAPGPHPHTPVRPQPQALLAFSLPPAAAAAHVAALHRLSAPQEGSEGAAAAPAAASQKGGVGLPAQWCGKLLDAAHDVLAKVMEKRGQVRGA